MPDAGSGTLDRPRHGEAVVRLRCGLCDRILAKLCGTPAEGLRVVLAAGPALDPATGQPGVTGPRPHITYMPVAGPVSLDDQWPHTAEEFIAEGQAVSRSRRFRCHRHCPGDYPVLTERLDVAFRVAATRERKRDRVIRLPMDLGRAS